MLTYETRAAGWERALLALPPLPERQHHGAARTPVAWQDALGCMGGSPGEPPPMGYPKELCLRGCPVLTAVPCWTPMPGGIPFILRGPWGPQPTPLGPRDLHC